jgi:hypothetical protein
LQESRGVPHGPGITDLVATKALLQSLHGVFALLAGAEALFKTRQNERLVNSLGA